ncbi:stevor [Plasmodium falciparum RAJ116]|uniref:Stevor n=1 Tax=Plasmodium falciparum RAJ116 TaxID=580058 RepID=A0A0L0CRP5_PLAFA|nr:stevor [Plasmodium falciparum RAJ116]
MLLFPFLFNTFLLSQNVNCQNNLRNKSLINNYTQRKILKSRCLAETEKPHNLHYQNDPELKKIIDRLNEEAMKKYQQSNDTYKQLHELLEKKETKSRSRNSEQEMSKIEKELLKIYEKMSGDENHIMQNLIYNLKTGCIGSVGACALSSAATEFAGNVAAGTAVNSFIQSTIFDTVLTKLTQALVGVNLLSETAIGKATLSIGTFSSYDSVIAVSFANSAFFLLWYISFVLNSNICYICIIIYMAA